MQCEICDLLECVCLPYLSCYMNVVPTITTFAAKCEFCDELLLAGEGLYFPVGTLWYHIECFDFYED